MSSDLTLLVVTSLTRERGVAHTLLPLVRRRELWDVVLDIVKEHGQPIPADFSTHFARIPDGSMKDECCYGRVSKDCYDTLLRTVEVRYLVGLREHEGVTDNTTNRATWAYLAALPGETMIALWWH